MPRSRRLVKLQNMCFLRLLQVLYFIQEEPAVEIGQVSSKVPQQYVPESALRVLKEDLILNSILCIVFKALGCVRL